MGRMRQKTKIGKALLQIAALVFFLNATSAFGSCCFAMAASDVMDAAGMEMPCHQTSDKGGDDSNTDDCCFTCMPMMASIDAKISNVPAATTPYIKAMPALITSSIDPLFRPPITPLS